MGQKEAFAEQMREVYGEFVIPTLEEELGGKIDIEAFSNLYHPQSNTRLCLAGKNEHPSLRINGISVWYEEDLNGIEITFEDGLTQRGSMHWSRI